MNVNSFQDRENVIPGQDFTKHCQELPCIARYCQALPGIAQPCEALLSIAKHFKIAKNKLVSNLLSTQFIQAKSFRKGYGQAFGKSSTTHVNLGKFFHKV